ncbi:DUF3168 domain-containing protein [Sinorhizobium meliloti]|nr:DUF3168 domain-containing protein [Sinorhizobium meliloti]MDW9847544.1 DUF3168 domain-containing protein [Sinorhizobium meliloti]MDX0144073.1 DUF3168 domain-containing protein [Sinorhizobium meliloti]MDX0150498.1 DUF3168 domain-containing protein [Sinorhizobium meliloti]MDX0169722.1 DUF3168 domain-containing protein [Sinorhizobium meliloti]
MEEALTALLASIAGGRRYWVRAPQTEPRPFVVLNRVDGVPSYHYQGASGLVASRVQLDCYADTYTAAKATARAVEAILSGYEGGIIQAIFLESHRDLPAADAGDVTNLFRASIDITVHHGENS